MLTIGRRPRHLPVFPVVILTLAALILAAFYRLPDLDQRVLHTDEAVHMVKLGEWMDEGQFIYDPHDFHGPTMYFATAAWMWLTDGSGKAKDTADRSANITISGVRTVIVVFGLLVVVSPLLFLHALGRGPAVTAALLLAVSPAFVYYSRYYIMEMLLVAFAAGALFCGWRWYLHRNRLWLALLGIMLGLMHATKETFVIHIAAAVGALCMMWLFRPRASGLILGDYRRKNLSFHWGDLLVPCIAFVFTSALLISNFFQHPSGIIDSYRTYLLYFDRAGGAGHEKPWYFYLQTLGWTRAGLVWTELFVLVLGAIGSLSVWSRRDSIERPIQFGRFLTFYSLFQFAAYSVIPYKTPWSILSAYYGWTLLAGVGISSLFHLSGNRFWRTFVSGLVIAGLWHLCLQARRSTDRFAADPRNPYVYSHTNPMLMRLVGQINDLQSLMPDGENLRVQIFEESHGWPLPWYFRDMPKVGYHGTYKPELEADVFIFESRWLPAMRQKLGDDFVQDGPHGLRPGLTLVAMVRRSLWDKLLVSRGVRPADPDPTPPEPDEPVEPPPAEDPAPVPPASPGILDWLEADPAEPVKPPYRRGALPTGDPSGQPEIRRARPAATDPS